MTLPSSTGKMFWSFQPMETGTVAEGMPAIASLPCGSMADSAQGIDGLFQAAVFGLYGTNTLIALGSIPDLVQAVWAEIAHLNKT